MKSQEEFDRFYTSELKHAIEQLETKRLAITHRFSYKRYKRILLGMAIGSVGLVLLGGQLEGIIPEQVVFLVPATLLYAIFAPVYIAIRRHYAFDPIALEYKQTVIPKIIAFLDSNLVYTPSGGISQEEFIAGGLFPKPTIGFKTEDLVEGKKGNVDFKISDIEAFRREQNRDKKSSSEMIFQGAYAIINLSQQFRSSVIIASRDQSTSMLGGIASLLLHSLKTQRNEEKGFTEVKSGDPAFDERFITYCQNVEDARGLVSPQFTGMLVAFIRETDVPLQFSFVDSHVHIAFSGLNLFDSDAGKSFVENDISKRYFNYLNLTIGIAEGLQGR